MVVKEIERGEEDLGSPVSDSPLGSTYGSVEEGFLLGVEERVRAWEKIERRHGNREGRLGTGGRGGSQTQGREDENNMFVEMFIKEIGEGEVLESVDAWNRAVVDTSVVEWENLLRKWREDRKKRKSVKIEEVVNEDNGARRVSVVKEKKARRAPYLEERQVEKGSNLDDGPTYLRGSRLKRDKVDADAVVLTGTGTNASTEDCGVQTGVGRPVCSNECAALTESGSSGNFVVPCKTEGNDDLDCAPSRDTPVTLSHRDHELLTGCRSEYAEISKGRPQRRTRQRCASPQLVQHFLCASDSFVGPQPSLDIAKPHKAGDTPGKDMISDGLPGKLLTGEDMSDKDMSDEDMSDEDLSDEDLSDEDLSDESLSDEDLSDEDLSDESLSDESLSDEDLSDESLSDESLSDESLSDESLSDESLSGEDLSGEDLSDEDIADSDKLEEKSGTVLPLKSSETRGSIGSHTVISDAAGSDVSIITPILKGDDLSLTDLGIEVITPGVSSEDEADEEDGGEGASESMFVKEGNTVRLAREDTSILGKGESESVLGEIAAQSVEEQTIVENTQYGDSVKHLNDRGESEDKKMKTHNSELARSREVDADTYTKNFEGMDRKTPTCREEGFLTRRPSSAAGDSDSVSTRLPERREWLPRVSSETGSRGRILVVSETEMSLSGLASEEVQVDWNNWEKTGGQKDLAGRLGDRKANQKMGKKQKSKIKKMQAESDLDADDESRRLNDFISKEKRRHAWNAHSGHTARPKRSLRSKVRSLGGVFRNGLKLWL